MKFFIVLVMMAAMFTSCGKSEGPAEPSPDDHDQGNVESFYNSDILRISRICCGIRRGPLNFVS